MIKNKHAIFYLYLKNRKTYTIHLEEKKLKIYMIIYRRDFFDIYRFVN